MPLIITEVNCDLAPWHRQPSLPISPTPDGALCANGDENNTMKQLEDFMDGVYNIEWITHQDHSYKAARLLVAGGGPNIWVNLQTNTVDGYWGADKRSYGFVDNIGLDDYLQELHESK